MTTVVGLDKEQSNVVPANDYLLELVTYQVRPSRGSGEPTVNLDFRVSQGELEGRHIYRNASLKLEALYWIRNLLSTMGITQEEFENRDAQGNIQPIEIEDLLDKAIERQPFVIGQVVVQPARKDPNTGEEYKEKNDIRKVRHPSTWAS